MSAVDVTVMVAWGAMCSVWSVLLWMQHRLRRDGTIVPVDVPEDGAGDASVTVVIPACNEAEAIAGCLDSVLNQDHPSLRVLVVDDRSEDRTAAIVEDYARRDEPVRLMRVESLPEGWLGKSNALWRATREIKSEWLLFLDADCRLLAKSAVRASLAEAKKRSAALLTLWPRHAAGGFWESLLIPLCGAITALWFGRSNSPSAAAFANGQFLMMRRIAYESIGGHETVRRAIIEDVPLAQAARSAGLTTWAGGGRDIVAVRMYESLAAIVRGWSRIFVGALRSSTKIALSMAWLLAGSCWPMIALPWLVIAWLRLDGAAPGALVPMTALCLTHLALIVLVSYRFWGLGHCDRRYLWLYPLSVVGVMLILADAWWAMAVRRRIGWRTTSYRFDRNAMIIEAERAPAAVP